MEFLCAERTDFKTTLTRTFGRAAAEYSQGAHLQHQGAKDLLRLLRGWGRPVPSGRILEIGCGTGFLTQGLLQHFPGHEFHVTDLSEPMVRYCQHTVQKHPSFPKNIQFEVLDGEHLENLAGTYALIISNFVVQWFENPLESLQKALTHLQPGGILAFAFPSQESFPEWKQICHSSNLPFTANVLPDRGHLLPPLLPQVTDNLDVTCWAKTYYETAYEFFHHLKQIGANCNTRQKKLSPTQFRQLLRAWDQQAKGQIESSYHLVFVLLQR